MAGSDNEMDWEPNFDIILDLSNYDSPNLSLGTLSNVSSEANFSLSFDDMDISLEDNNQFGGAQYQIELIRERNIVKFNVQGYEYRIKVEAIDRNITFDVAVQMLHGLISG